MGRKPEVGKTGFRKAVRTPPLVPRGAFPSPPPDDGNAYREILQDRVAVRFGVDAVVSCWSMGLPDDVMLDPAGPVIQALDRLDELRQSKATLSKTAERSVFLLFVKQWQQGYLGSAYNTQQRHRRVGRKTAAANRKKKATIDARRADAIVDMYKRARKSLEAGHAGDVQARRNVARRWEAANGYPITDRTIRNILDAAGIKRHRRGGLGD